MPTSPKSSSKKKDVIVEKLVKQLTHVRAYEHVDMVLEDMIHVLETVKPILLAKPMLLEIKSPTYVLGDIHGQFHDLLTLFDLINYPSSSNQMLFLGDYVDRGKYGLESMILLFSLKIMQPQRIHLLRGNHESKSVTRVYGFYEECKSRYNLDLWKEFVEVFDCLPVAARINGVVLCMHGGLSPQLNNLLDITKLSRPTDVPQSGLLTDLLWADPDKKLKDGWADNPRKVSFVFAASTVKEFCKKNDLDVIIRAHQVVFHGYEIFADGKMITVFTAPNFCGQFENMGGIIHISKNLKLTMSFLDGKSKDKKAKKQKSHKRKTKTTAENKETKAKTSLESVDVQQPEKTVEATDSKKQILDKEKLEPTSVVLVDKAKDKSVYGQTNSKILDTNKEGETNTEMGTEMEKNNKIKEAGKKTTKDEGGKSEEENESPETSDEENVSSFMDTISSTLTPKKP